jgi:LPS-assembly protein
LQKPGLFVHRECRFERHHFLNRIHGFLLGILLLLCGFPKWGQSQTSPAQAPVLPSAPSNNPVTIQAREQYRTSKHEFIAKGDVEVRYQDMLLKADEVWGNDETQDVEGEGNVYFEQDQQKVHGRHFQFNLKSKTGSFYDVKGRVDPGFFFEAQEVDKLSEKTYRVKEGVVTACEDKVPKWSFSVKDGILKVDSQITMKHSFFRVKKVPIFYSPYMVAPTVDTSRKSGFLIPSTGNSNTKGRVFRDSFYLTLGRSADLLATGEYFSLRGPAGEMELRARPGKDSHIFAQGFFAIDRLGQGGQSARVIADTQFQNGFRGVAYVDVVSSQTFRQVYGDSFNTIFRPDQVSSGFLTRNFSTYSVNFFGERRSTIYSPQPVRTRTLPSFDLFSHAHQVKDWPVYLSFDTAVDGLSRTDSRVDTPPVVQRFDLYPRLTVPLLKFWNMSFTPSVGVRETFYSERLEPALPGGVSPNHLVRSAMDFQGKFHGPTLARVFEVGKKRYKHVIEPEVNYRYIAGVKEFQQTILFDERDVLTNTNQIEYFLNNRFFSRRPTTDGGTTTAEFLSVRIGQMYFFDPTFGGALVPGRRNFFNPVDLLTAFAFLGQYHRFSPLITRVRFTPAQRYIVDFRLDYDPKINKLRASSVSSWVYLANNFIGLTYYNTRDLPPNQRPSNQVRFLVGYGNFTRRGVNAAWSVIYDFNTKTRQYNTAQLAYNWDCCGVALELRQVGLRQLGLQYRNESQFRFTFSLKNVGSFGNLRRQERLF